MRRNLFPSLNISSGKSNRSIRRLILKQRWECLSRYLATEEGRQEVERFEKDAGNEGQTALHLICNFDPPLDVVQQLYEICPLAVSRFDTLGRTPLHIAAPVCESAGVMRYLVERCPGSASMVDNEGKTPLILLCEHARFDVDDDPFILAGYDRAWSEVFDAAVALCDAAPASAVNVEDCTGKSALEYAMINDADADLVNYLMVKSDEAISTESELNRLKPINLPEDKMIHMAARQKQLQEHMVLVERKVIVPVSKAA